MREAPAPPESLCLRLWRPGSRHRPSCDRGVMQFEAPDGPPWSRLTPQPTPHRFPRRTYRAQNQRETCPTWRSVCLPSTKLTGNGSVSGEFEDWRMERGRTKHIELHQARDGAKAPERLPAEAGTPTGRSGLVNCRVGVPPSGGSLRGPSGPGIGLRQGACSPRHAGRDGARPSSSIGRRWL